MNVRTLRDFYLHYCKHFSLLPLDEARVMRGVEAANCGAVSRRDITSLLDDAEPKRWSNVYSLFTNAFSLSHVQLSLLSNDQAMLASFYLYGKFRAFRHEYGDPSAEFPRMEDLLLDLRTRFGLNFYLDFLGKAFTDWKGEWEFAT